MKNFCHNIFTGLDISPSGQIKPCCKFLSNEIPKFNIRDGIDQYQKSDFVKNLKKQIMNDERPKGCQRCWIEEDAGIKSKRQLDYIRHKANFDKLPTDHEGYTNVSIAFGNICNFSCRICGPNQSSKWVSELFKNENIRYPIHDWYKEKNILEDIYNHTRDAIHFDIPGGEPLLLEIAEHFDFLNRFEKERKNEISLHYTTNGSNFPKQEFIDIWKEFKEVDIQISVDDTGKRFEYNRWPGKWQEVYDNIKKFQMLEKQVSNIRLSISFSVSVFTVFYSDEFFKWCRSEGLPDPWMGRVNNPSYYRPGVLGKKINQKIREHLCRSNFFEVRKLASLVVDSDQNPKEFFYHSNKLDMIRKQNFSKVFPELVC